ncbi:MAG: hypothetical protein ACLFTK_04780 [Anaerolineales bacterium]
MQRSPLAVPALSNTYILPALVVVILPAVCGCIIIIMSFFQAIENVEVWRNEFQHAVDQQCPNRGFDIQNGEGIVYLDGYREQYQWYSNRAGDIICESNGRTISCSCAEDITSTSVTAEQ